VVAWLNERKPDAALKAQVLAMWPKQAAGELDKAVEAASPAPQASQLLERVVTTLR